MGWLFAFMGLIVACMSPGAVVGLLIPVFICIFIIMGVLVIPRAFKAKRLSKKEMNTILSNNGDNSIMKNILKNLWCLPLSFLFGVVGVALWLVITLSPKEGINTLKKGGKIQ